MSNRRTRLSASGLTGRILLACAWLAVAAEPARAQLDPLLFVKRVPPNVIVVVDTSMRMLEDVEGYYYDPNFYNKADNEELAGLLGVTSVTYRRKYQSLQYTNLTALDSPTYAASTIVGVPAVWDPSNSATSNAAADEAFFDPTRISIAKRGILRAVAENSGAEYRWGLMRLRQRGARFRTGGTDCSQPVVVTDPNLDEAGDTTPCNALLDSQYGIYDPTVDIPNFSLTSGGSPSVVTPGPNTAASMMHFMRLHTAHDGGLVPAGRGSATFEDRPLTFALEDAKAAVQTLMADDSAATLSCRNSVVVLITSGANAGDAAYMTAYDAADAAATFKTVNGGGVVRRVPIYVIAIAPPAGEEPDLQAIATASGGRYFHVRDAVSVTRAVNLALQAGFSRKDDFQTSTPSEFTGVSPIIGTVNLTDAPDMTGTELVNDVIHVDDDPVKQVVPQRSNVMITAGFSLPGFDGRIRAFRTYEPVRDTTKVSGWRFESDGTRLWPDLDSRPWLAGTARAPADPALRNVYTAIPNGTGVDIVAFTAANAPQLASHLVLPAGLDAATLISAIRGMPIGAVIGSTPALMDPPSLDPPPDGDYGRPDDSTLTFAAKHKNRRAMIFVGANDGMIHAIDARTGYEVWAFIPYNLLPKLKTLIDGQPIQQFDFFVDSSPKIAEVKMNTGSGHEWRSLLIIGQGPGGTFYQAFDVTGVGMTVAPDAGSLSDVTQLLQEFDAPDEGIKFLWSFPNYNSFDPAIAEVIDVWDATPGGKVKVYGDLKPTATYVEKTVGYTWSDPAVGPLDANRDVNVVMVGSGYFPPVEDDLPGRDTDAPRAGRYFYLLKVEDGTLLGNATGSSCDTGFGCIDAGEQPPDIKNALQADPSAAGDNGVPIVKKAYMGDLDGRYWRFDFNETGALAKSLMINTGQPIFSSSALLFIGSSDVYMFFSSGSDLFPTSSPFGTGTFRLFSLKDNYPGGGATPKFIYDLAPVSNVGGLAHGERPSTAPSVAGDIVFFTTTTEDASAPCSDFTGNLYAFTYLGGPAYDTDNNNRLDTGESPRVREMAGRATSPFIVDQHLYLGTAGNTGFQVEMFGDPQDFNNGVGQVGIRVLSWREIR